MVNTFFKQVEDDSVKVDRCSKIGKQTVYSKEGTVSPGDLSLQGFLSAIEAVGSSG